jgi:hypothetical protein
MHFAIAVLASLLLTFSARSTSAQTNTAARTAKPKYSIPWGLRPAMAPRIIRSDNSLALSDGGTAFVSTWLAGYRLMPDVLLFGLYTPAIAKEWRLPVFVGVTLPFGSGGGTPVTPWSTCSP